jgi:hypothetical protein
MASRRRMIHDGIFCSGDLVDLPAAARWLWLGLIVYADDDGMFRDNVRFFQRTILSGLRVSQERILTWLALFVSRGMLSTCKFNDVSGYRITNFFRFQKLKRHEIENKDLRQRTCTLSAGRTQKTKLDGDHQASIRHPSDNLKVVSPCDTKSQGANTRGKGREENRREGNARVREDTAAVFHPLPSEPPEEDRHRDLVEQLQAVSGQVVHWRDADWTIGFAGISNGSGACLFHSLDVKDLEILVDVTSLNPMDRGTPGDDRTVAKNASQRPSSGRLDP